jgi:hypothetical protein
MSWLYHNFFFPQTFLKLDGIVSFQQDTLNHVHRNVKIIKLMKLIQIYNKKYEINFKTQFASSQNDGRYQKR